MAVARSEDCVPLLNSEMTQPLTPALSNGSSVKRVMSFLLPLALEMKDNFKTGQGLRAHRAF